MRIGKIVSGAEYRMDEQFQNLVRGQNLEQSNVEDRYFRISNIRIFQIYFLFLYLFELLEHSKYMIHNL